MMLCQVANSIWGAMLQILWMFVRIAIGGPIFGWVMAKVVIFCLSRILNDATVEITLTLVAAYMTYFVGNSIAILENLGPKLYTL